MTEGWHKDLRFMLQSQDPSEAAVLRIQSAHPNVPERPSLGNVTIAGDAIHAMSPTGGAGANTALRDAALLGKLLGESWDEKKGWKEGAIRKIVEDYETERCLGTPGRS